MTLMDAINKARQRVWAQQHPEFFEQAFLDADGTLVRSDDECIEGLDFAYDGHYGYHPLLISRWPIPASHCFCSTAVATVPFVREILAHVFLDKAVAFAWETGFARSCCVEIRTSLRPSIWIAGDAAGNIRFIFRV